MNTNKRLLALTISLILLTPLLSCRSKKLPVKDIKIICRDGREFTVAAEIAEKTEMLFIFERDQILSFWMKNTPHPLSIAYIDSKGRIRDIFDMTPYSTASINSTVSVRYALEVPQGWYKKNGITPGDAIDISVIE